MQTKRGEYFESDKIVLNIYIVFMQSNFFKFTLRFQNFVIVYF